MLSDVKKLNFLHSSIGTSGGEPMKANLLSQNWWEKGKGGANGTLDWKT